MIDEAREDNKENDAQYMKPSIGSRCRAPFLQPTDKSHTNSITRISLH